MNGVAYRVLVGLEVSLSSERAERARGVPKPAPAAGCGDRTETVVAVGAVLEHERAARAGACLAAAARLQPPRDELVQASWSQCYALCARGRGRGPSMVNEEAVPARRGAVCAPRVNGGVLPSWPSEKPAAQPHAQAQLNRAGALCTHTHQFRQLREATRLLAI